MRMKEIDVWINKLLETPDAQNTCWLKRGDILSANGILCQLYLDAHKCETWELLLSDIWMFRGCSFTTPLDVGFWIGSQWIPYIIRNNEKAPTFKDAAKKIADYVQKEKDRLNRSRKKYVLKNIIRKEK